MAHPTERLARHIKAAPVNVEGAVRDFGIALKKNCELSPGIAGQIRRVADDRYEIATTRDDHYYRQRFTMAHELGHYLLHRSLIGEGVDDDVKYRSTESGEFYNTMIDAVHERQANSFAANFLMPQDLIMDAVLDSDPRPTLKELARKFQVSPSAMRWRLGNLRLLEKVEDS